MKVVIVIMSVLSAASAAYADTWRGTAPFCNGECLPGETLIMTDDCGDGGCCWSGHKVLCRNDEPLCEALQTKTRCAGVILICQDGHFIGGIESAFVACSTYVCGACLGFSLASDTTSEGAEPTDGGAALETAGSSGSDK